MAPRPFNLLLILVASLVGISSTECSGQNVAKQTGKLTPRPIEPIQTYAEEMQLSGETNGYTEVEWTYITSKKNGYTEVEWTYIIASAVSEYVFEEALTAGFSLQDAHAFAAMEYEIAVEKLQS